MANNSSDQISPLFKSAFEADTDLSQYGDNALSIFTLSLYLKLEDIQEFAVQSVTDGSNDKKVDICFIDEVDGRAIIVQGYFSKVWGKAAAPANKASDLNAGMAWLLSASEDRIPKNLKTKAVELRRALYNNSIKRIELLYIHNCYESQNAEDELKAVAEATRDIVKSLIKDKDVELTISYRELGLDGIEELYKSRESDILIDDWITVPVSGFLEESGDDWKAILITVSGDWLRDLFKEYGEPLFSANYRDYLGYVKRSGNINYQMSQTADSEPINFWVYNNGITALTHELRVQPSIQIRGISIINGAQTTGALANSSSSSAKVLMRIVECQSKVVIDKIIQYNNTQNEIKPADRRSNDMIQRRLRSEFSQYNISYIHRRSTARTTRNSLSAAAVAPAICAFHGDPQTSYRNAKEIFNDDAIYTRVFPNQISVEHVFMLKSLSTAIDLVKADLKRKVSEAIATEMEEQQYEVLKYSASKHFIFFIVGVLAEEIMGRRVSDLFAWKCRTEIISPESGSMVRSWDAALRALLPIIASIMKNYGDTASYDVPRSMEHSKSIAKELRAIIASLDSVLGRQFAEIRRRTVV